MDKGFPETDLLELESRIFKDQWSIPYKKNESFHICLSAATKLLDQGFFTPNFTYTKSYIF